MVFTFSDLHEQLWRGSSAVTAIENSIDSQRAHLEDFFSPSTRDVTNCNDTSFDKPILTHQENDETDEENDSEQLPLTANDITNNRERVNEILKYARKKNISTGLENDEQMLNIAKEDVLLKRKLISQFEKSVEELNTSISKISKTMKSIGNAMQQCWNNGRTDAAVFFTKPTFYDNQNIQSNIKTFRRPNYNAGYDTAQRNFSTFVDEVNEVSSNS